jgi:hypothetical protein
MTCNVDSDLVESCFSVRFWKGLNLAIRVLYCPIRNQRCFFGLLNQIQIQNLAGFSKNLAEFSEWSFNRAV